MKKTCSRCKEEKSVDDFVRDKSSKNGRHSWCKGCLYPHVREYIKNNPEVNRRKAIRWQKKQVELGKCRICGKKEFTKGVCKKHRDDANRHKKRRRKLK